MNNSGSAFGKFHRSSSRHSDTTADMSGHFIGVLTTKKVEEFNAALREKISGGSVL